MKKQLKPASGFFNTGIPLQQLVTSLVNDSQPAASLNKTSIVNEVDHGVFIKNKSEKPVTIIKELLATVIQNSWKGDIHITAERYHDIIVLQIQERNNYNGYALSFSVGAIEPDAISAGGHISIDGSRQKIATISFSFPTLFAA